MPVKLRMSLEEPQHLSARENAFEMAIGNDRHLVDVFTRHQLQSLHRWSIWCYHLEIPQRTHNALHTGLCPLIARHLLHLVRRNEPHQIAILSDNKAAATAPQHVFINEVLQTKVRLYGPTVALHDVGNSTIAETRDQFYVNVAAA